jgi:hypothetical protein
MFKRLICPATVMLMFGWGGSFAFGQGNLILNGEFDDGLNSWALYGSAGFTVSVVEDGALSGYNAALFDVTNAGAGNSIGIAQSVQFEQGKTYKIGLTARASQSREMVILMQLYTPAPSWTDIFMVKVPLTTKAQTFVYEYTHTRETTSANAGWSVDVYYMLKGQSWAMSGSDLNCKVWLDRVYIGQEPPAQHRYRAAGPKPADGAAIEKTSYMLQWIPGDFAVSHRVYFSDSLDDVNKASVTAVTTTRPDMAVGMPGELSPEGLTPGTTYYWRVDEVNDTNLASPWKGDVWSFLVRPRTAWQPSPVDGAELVKPDQDLTWEKGVAGLFHMVYFGESFDAVNDATTGGMMIVAAAYDPGMMGANKTYFWRIDTFDGLKWYKGQVWSFTTVPDVAITDPDLAGWWTLDEGKGTTAIDWSGHGGHGTLIGGPQWVDGFYGGALSFTGTGQYLNCGTAAADITGDFTLATWIKMAPANSGKYMGIAGRLNGVYQGFGLVRHSSDVLRMWVGDGTTDLAKSAVSSDATYADTEWHHVAAVHEGQANRLFVDGKKQVGTTNVTLVPNPEFFHIGRQYSHMDDRYFNGLIDDVRVYSKAMTEEQINQVLAGNPLVASSPTPGIGAIVDVGSADALSWSAGAGAISHDVYFGTDRKAVAEADKNSPEFKGNQPGASFSLSGLVAFGGGDYYWRIDEVEAGGQVHTGYVWKFTVPAFLIVDDFEGYSDDTDAYNAVFQTWLDGYGYTQPVEVAGNGTSSTIGYGEPRNGTFCETVIVNAGGSGQSMPFDYNNINAPYYAETSRTWSTPQDWTKEGVSTLMLYVSGTTGNDATQPLYVALENQGKAPVVVNLDAAALSSTDWTEQKIPLSRFTGANLGAIKRMYIGVGDRKSPKPGGHGILYIDDIRVTKP